MKKIQKYPEIEQSLIKKKYVQYVCLIDLPLCNRIDQIHILSLPMEQQRS